MACLLLGSLLVLSTATQENNDIEWWFPLALGCAIDVFDLRFARAAVFAGYGFLFVLAVVAALQRML